MNKFIINIRSFYITLLAIMFVGFSACEIDDFADPNGPSLSGVLTNASRSDLQTVVTGIESLMRKEIYFYYYTVGIIGRDWYFFTNADPRYTGELLGRENSVLDNAGFYGTRPYTGRYKTVKMTNILQEAVANNSQNLSLTSEEVNGYVGFAKAIQAYELHLNLNLQYQNGIRLDVSDPDNLGPFLSYSESLAGIRALLEESSAALANAGSGFPFVLSSGFAGFNTPATFREFVNGLAARIAIYQGDKAAALSFLDQSFLDVTGDFYEGPFRPYSISSGEQINEIFRSAGQTEALIAHPQWVADLEAGDDRHMKVAPRDPITLDGLTGDHDVVVYPTLESPIWLIRNEELILIRAEARIGSNNAGALDDLNVIRNGHGLPDYSGPADDASLLNEVIRQRRYSLFAEGHRWVDMRRLGRLNELPIDRAGDDVWEQLPRPVTEV